MKPRVIIPTMVIAALAMLVAVKLSHLSRHPLPESNAAISAKDEAKEVDVREATVTWVGRRRAPTAPATTDSREAGAVSLTVRDITNREGDLWARQKAARALPLNLSDADQKGLMRFLKVRQADDDGQGGHVLKNDLMDALVAQTSLAPELAAVLTEIDRDASQHEVIRDYAVQHLCLLSERLNEPIGWGADQVNSQRNLIQQALWEAANKPESSIAGTALLGLARLSETDTSVDPKRLTDLALNRARAVDTQEATRITALQVCARLQIKEALPLLVTAAERESGVSLRISAIGALGLMGGEREIAVLERIAQNNNPRLAVATAAAVKRIRQRLGQG